MSGTLAVKGSPSIFSAAFLKSCLGNTEEEQNDRAQMVAKGIFVGISAASTSFFANRFEVISLSNPVRWVGSWVQIFPFGASLVLTVYFAYNFFEDVDPTGLTPLIKDKSIELVNPYMEKLLVYSRPTKKGDAQEGGDQQQLDGP